MKFDFLPLIFHLNILKKVGWSWCYLSGGPKPPRAHFSHTDGACIPAMDHFCPYLGKCVGAHNHAPFLRYILSLWAACAYILVVWVYNFPHFIAQVRDAIHVLVCLHAH